MTWHDIYNKKERQFSIQKERILSTKVMLYIINKSTYIDRWEKNVLECYLQFLYNFKMKGIKLHF